MDKKLEGITQGLPVFGDRLDQGQREWSKALTAGVPERQFSRDEGEIVDEFARRKKNLPPRPSQDDSLIDGDMADGSSEFIWADFQKNSHRRLLEEEIEDWFDDLIDAHLVFENFRLRQMMELQGEVPSFPVRARPPEVTKFPPARPRARLWRMVKQKLEKLIGEMETERALETIIRYADIIELLDCPPTMDDASFKRCLQRFGLSGNEKRAEKQVRLMEEEGIIPPPHAAGGGEKGRLRSYSMIHARGARACLALRRFGIQLPKMKEVLEPLTEAQKILFLYPFLYGEGLSMALISSPALPHSVWAALSFWESLDMIAHFKKAVSLTWMRHSDERSLESPELSETEKHELLLTSAMTEARRRARAIIALYIQEHN
jgi:hypothetical protein